jgi:Tol biopolymer transport system component
MRARGKPPGLAGFAVAAGVFALVVPVAADAAFPGKNGRIAFTAQVRERGETVSSRIETVLPSGRGRRVLGICPGDQGCLDTDPSWSPSGRLLAFVRGRGRLAVVGNDGTGLRQLPQFTENDGEPAWSPKGRRLAFIGDGPRLYTVRRNGTGLRQVTPRYAVSPTWSLASTIAFVHRDLSPSTHDDGIYTTRPGGSRLRRLVDDPDSPGPPEAPDWSPHASRIAFVLPGSVNPEIHVANAKGRDRRRLTSDGTEPAWSPDGKYIAFIRNWDLYVMRSNGRGLRLVADGGRLESGEQIYLDSPSWRPLPPQGAPATAPSSPGPSGSPPR